MYAFAPNGVPIRGTLERTPGCALTIDDAFERDEDGDLTYDHAGETEVSWDGQETLTTTAGETIFLDDEGGQWSKSQLVLTDDPDWEPETESDAAEAETADETLRRVAREILATWDSFDTTGPVPPADAGLMDRLIGQLRTALQMMKGS